MQQRVVLDLRDGDVQVVAECLRLCARRDGSRGVAAVIILVLQVVTECLRLCARRG